MARRVEPIIKRIARGLNLSEEALSEFLVSESSHHLIWKGAHEPRLPRTRIVHARCGLDRRQVDVPRPIMRGGLSPTRLLFCHHHQLDELDSRITLRCDCGATSCISPLHRRMTQSFRGGFVPLPELASRRPSEVDLLVELLTFDEESYRHHPENLAHYPPETVAEAFKRLGWEMPTSKLKTSEVGLSVMREVNS